MCNQASVEELMRIGNFSASKKAIPDQLRKNESSLENYSSMY